MGRRRGGLAAQGVRRRCVTGPNGRAAGRARPGPVRSWWLAARRSVAVGAAAPAPPEAGQGGCGGAGRVRAVRKRFP